ncbi:MAG: hypothetical protein ACPGQS_08120, partial [Bradymonadia bacterium]
TDQEREAQPNTEEEDPLTQEQIPEDEPDEPLPPSPAEDEDVENGEPVPTIQILDADVSDASYFSSGELDETVTYMIGVYQSHGNHGFNDHPTGEAIVHIGAQAGRIELVLSSYEPVDWTLSGPGVANIDRLLVLGYHTQNVHAPDLSITPDIFTHDNGGAETISILFDRFPLVHEWAELSAQADCQDVFELSDPADYEANELACDWQALQGMFALGLIDAFAGAYEATEFRILPTSDENGFEKPVDPPARPELTTGTWQAEYYDVSRSNTSPVYVETVNQPTINYPWSDFHGIRSEDFMANWTGDISLSAPGAIEIIFESNGAVDMTIDGRPAELRNGRTGTLDAGTHQIRITFRNAWHTTYFQARFAVIGERSSLTPSTTQRLINESGHADAEVFVADIYEAQNLYNRIQLNVSPSDRPLVLVLAGFRGVHWVVNNPSQREILAITVVGGSLCHLVDASLDIPIFQARERIHDNASERDRFVNDHFGLTTYGLAENYYGDAIDVP